jgi:hypothetical protein
VAAYYFSMLVLLFFIKDFLSHCVVFKVFFSSLNSLCSWLKYIINSGIGNVNIHNKSIKLHTKILIHNFSWPQCQWWIHFVWNWFQPYFSYVWCCRQTLFVQKSLLGAYKVRGKHSFNSRSAFLMTMACCHLGRL